MRVAIEASLSAYKIALEPDTARSFIKRKGAFRNIKRHFDRENKKDANMYPLTAPLLKAYAGCSRFGSHASIDSFFNRLDLKRNINDGKEELEMRFFYFQFPLDVQEFYQYFDFLMGVFIALPNLFFIMFKEREEVSNLKFDEAIAIIKREFRTLKESRISSD